MKLLHLDSSILGDNSVSRQLSAELVAQIKRDQADVDVTYHDLAANPINPLSGGLFAAQAAKPEERSAEQQADVDAGATALETFLAADIVVVGAPMYNFTIPSQLKAWLDRVAVAGKTFRYTAEGAIGLAGGKHVIVVSSRGGFYSEGAMAALDHQEAYLKTIFAFMGITDVKFIRAEGVATGAEQRAKASGTLMLEGEKSPLLPVEMEQLSETEVYVILHEGRYHQVRRMFAALGNHVNALHRDSIGGLTLPADLSPGQYRLMGPDVIAQVFAG